MMHIIDSTALCVPLQPRILRPDDIDHVVVHRISLATYDEIANPNPIPDDSLTGPELELRFRNKALKTGGIEPYTVLVRHNGDKEQMLPLLVRGAHAAAYNRSSWSVAVAGNTDEREMRDCQWESLIEVVSVLAILPRSVAGHTELPMASDDPRKRCPGKFVNMNWVREAVDRRLPIGSEFWDIRRRLSWITSAGFAL